jgi:hypothetical protein
VPPAPLAEAQHEVGTDLVEVRPPPLPPDPRLRALYRAAVEARVSGDLERAAVYLRQVVHGEHGDPNFEDGIAASDLEGVEAQLRPIHIQNFRTQALAAAADEDWRAAAGAWQALLGIDPNNEEAERGLNNALRSRAERAHREGHWGEEIGAWEALLKLLPQDTQAPERITVAEQNQQGALLYGNAQAFVKEGKLAAARDQLEKLWGKPPAYEEGKAPYYGDPAGIGPIVGMTVPPSYEQAKAERERNAELERQRLAAERAERERNAELERQRRDVEEQKRKAQQAKDDVRRRREQLRKSFVQGDNCIEQRSHTTSRWLVRSGHECRNHGC